MVLSLSLSLSTINNNGDRAGNMSLNNRSFAFKLTLKKDLDGVKKGRECLFLYGLGGKGTIEGVKKLQDETGLKAVALLCNGSGHHTYLR